MAGQFCCWEYQVWLYHCWEAVGKIQYGFWDYCRGYLCLYWLGVQEKSIGYGDGLVILCMGCFYALGEMMAIVMIAITIAGIAALGLLIFGHKNRKSEFPFVPFLLGAHLVMWGLQG